MQLKINPPGRCWLCIVLRMLILDGIGADAELRTIMTLVPDCLVDVQTRHQSAVDCEVLLSSVTSHSVHYLLHICTFANICCINHKTADDTVAPITHFLLLHLMLPANLKLTRTTTSFKTSQGFIIL